MLTRTLHKMPASKDPAKAKANWSKILKTDMKALRSESEERRKQFGTMKCRIVTHAGKRDRNVVVEIFPSKPPKDRTVDARVRTFRVYSLFREQESIFLLPILFYYLGEIPNFCFVSWVLIPKKRY